MFKDRIDAGQKLAKVIKRRLSFDPKNSIVLALPRGGVVVAAEVARDLKLPLDIIVTRKIGAPLNPEYAIAAVGEHSLVLNQREKVDNKYLKMEVKKERQEIRRRLKKYRGRRKILNLKNKQVVLIDDGLATGLTMEAAIEEVKTHYPQKIILAVPVAPPDGVQRLNSLAGEVIVLQIEPNFFAIGQFYQDFGQTADEEVINILSSFC